MNSGSSVSSARASTVASIEVGLGEALDDELESSDKEEEEVGHGDVPCGRLSDLGTDSPKQPVLPPSQYPLTAFGRKLRRFNPGWFSGRPWLEYIALNVMRFSASRATR